MTQQPFDRNDPFAAAQELARSRRSSAGEAGEGVTTPHDGTAKHGAATDVTGAKLVDGPTGATSTSIDTIGTVAPVQPTLVVPEQQKKPGRKNAGRPHPLQAYVDSEIHEFLRTTYRTRRENGDYWESKAELVNALLHIALSEIKAKRVTL